MVRIKHHGDFKNTERFLQKAPKINYMQILHQYGKIGVDALSSMTPTDSGETARSWDYKIEKNARGIALIWTNSHIHKGVPVAILIQYDHGTRTGGYIKGRDYINPALYPIFDEIRDNIWKGVTSL